MWVWELKPSGGCRGDFFLSRTLKKFATAPISDGRCGRCAPPRVTVLQLFASQSPHMPNFYVAQAFDPHPEFDPSLPLVRRAADTLMLATCGLGAVVALAVGWHFEQFELAAGLVAALSAGAVLVYVLCRGTWLSSLCYPVLLASFIALHLQLAGGKTEYHFGVFVAFAFLLAYRHRP